MGAHSALPDMAKAIATWGNRYVKEERHDLTMLCSFTMGFRSIEVK